MKELTVSVKTGDEVLSDLKKTYAKVRDRKLKKSHFEISFDNKKDFDRFVRNIHLLSDILVFKPKSVYELAKISGKDVSNITKIMTFMEDMQVIRLKESIVSGRLVKTPVIDYDRVQFNLAA